MNLRLLTLALLITTPIAFAGDKGGNGGDAVVCDTGVELLDSYELRSRGLSLGLQGETRREMIEDSLNSIKRIDPVLERAIRGFAIELEEAVAKIEAGEESELLRFTMDSLRDIPDSQETTIPYGCSLKQLVIQQKPVVFEKRYTIDQRIWNELSMDQQALTVTHEAWYRATLDKGATNSRYARMMNGIFASTKKDVISLKDYLEYARHTNDLSGFPFVYSLTASDLFPGSQSKVTYTFAPKRGGRKLVLKETGYKPKVIYPTTSLGDQVTARYVYPNVLNVGNSGIETVELNFSSADFKVGNLHGKAIYGYAIWDAQKKAVLSSTVIGDHFSDGDKVIFKPNLASRYESKMGKFLTGLPAAGAVVALPVLLASTPVLLLNSAFGTEYFVARLQAVEGSSEYEYQNLKLKDWEKTVKQAKAAQVQEERMIDQE